MKQEELVFVGTSDLAGHVRGKAFPAADLAARLRKGVGLTHSNIMMSAFGPVDDTPYGTIGDLMLVPDPTAKVLVTFDETDRESFYLGDIRTTEGEPWTCCPRSFLRRALDSLHAETGLTLLAAFEHELVYTGVEHRPGATYALDAFRRQRPFGEMLMAALREAGLRPDSFLPEYGERQYEVTISPSEGMRAADEGVILREIARAVANRLGHRAIFAPMLNPKGIGNGTHIHFSLRDERGKSVMQDAQGPYGLADPARRFAAGILHHLPALTAITAPSVASYYRLRPHRWAPTWTNLAERDRGASVRICPVFTPAAEEPADQFNIEYRVADATASPYMALGALVWAGLDGMRKDRKLPPAPIGSFWDMAEAERVAAGAQSLPQSLGEALGKLAATAEAVDWFGQELLEVYLRLKRAEISGLADLGADAICARYAEAY
jgi:glutamine synthetase